MGESNHVETFNCPHCGAPIEYDGKGERTEQCSFCGNSSEVPESILPQNAAIHTAVPLAGLDQAQEELVGQALDLVEIVKLAKAGNKIEAIKLYRQKYGVSLLDAKTAVEQMGQVRMSQVGVPAALSPSTNWDNLGAPVSAPKTKSSAGCIVGSAILVFVIAIMGIVFFILPSSSSTREPDVSTFQQTARAKMLAQLPTAAAEPTEAPSPSPTPVYANATLTFGAQGVGAGKFTNAARIGIDAKGNVYVGEYNGGRVQVFDSQGKILNQFFAGNSTYKLEGFAVDAKGIVYASDDTVILRFNGLTGDKLGPLAYHDGPGFGELATSPGGVVAAMWYPHHDDGLRGAPESVVLFDASAKVTQVISAPVSSRTGEFEHSIVPKFDGDGNLYLLSYVSGAIFKFDSDGKYINRFGSAGKDIDQLYLPSTMAVDSQGQLYVVDFHGVAMFSPDGRFLRRFGTKNTPRGMVFDDQDALWSVESSSVSKYVLGN